MKRAAQVVSLAALAGTILPPVLFFYGRMELDAMKAWMLGVTGAREAAQATGLPVVVENGPVRATIMLEHRWGQSSFKTFVSLYAGQDWVEVARLGRTRGLKGDIFADADSSRIAQRERVTLFRGEENLGEFTDTHLSLWDGNGKLLAENDNNISATARALKMHRRTLQRKLAKRPVKD